MLVSGEYTCETKRGHTAHLESQLTPPELRLMGGPASPHQEALEEYHQAPRS